MAVAFVKDFFLVVASKCPEDESGNFLEVLEEVLYYFCLIAGTSQPYQKLGDGGRLVVAPNDLSCYRDLELKK